MMAPQDGPRSPQDGSKIVLDRFFRLLIFGFDFGSFFVPFWCRFGLPNDPPGERTNCWSGPWGGSKTVLKSSWCGSLVVLSLGIAFLVVLGSFWGRLRVVLGSFEGRFDDFSALQPVDSTYQRINSSIQPINSSTYRFNSSTHRLIHSTHQPINSIDRRSMSSVQSGPAVCAQRD